MKRQSRCLKSKLIWWFIIRFYDLIWFLNCSRKELHLIFLFWCSKPILQLSRLLNGIKTKSGFWLFTFWLFINNYELLYISQNIKFCIAFARYLVNKLKLKPKRICFQFLRLHDFETIRHFSRTWHFVYIISNIKLKIIGPNVMAIYIYFSTKETDLIMQNRNRYTRSLYI